MKENYSQELHLRYEQVLEKIEKSAHTTGRNSDLIKLIVVTKTHPLERIYAALELGIRNFGENYPEEAVEKINAVGAVDGLNWHMIGHVQSRKADLVAKNFSCVHSLDSYKLADKLNRFAMEGHRILPVLIECNVSGEESKFGYPAFEKSQWDNFLVEVEKLSQFTNLQILGLMTMPPFFEDAEKTRPYFKKLSDLQKFLKKGLPTIRFEDLSMGTSIDFQAAIEEGATIVRVGTAIMGSRPPKQPGK